MQGGRRYVHLLPDDYDTRRFYTTIQLAPDGTTEQESYLVDLTRPDEAIVLRHLDGPRTKDRLPDLDDVRLFLRFFLHR